MRDRPAGRIGSLDGLRGVAAAVVLVHHSLLTIPSFANGNLHLPVPDSRSWLVYSPLHAFWAGGEAVFVFFVLSGFVLTLPALRRTQDWIAYFPSRFIRLYLPVVASVFLALLLFLAVPRTGAPGQSAWVARHAESLSLGGFLGDLTLLAPTRMNSPLWSLTWEVAFSLLLPLFVSIAALTRRHWWITAIVAALLSTAGHPLRMQWLTYLSMFLVGSAIAAGWERIPAVKRPLGWVLFLASLLGITCAWWIPSDMPGAVFESTVITAAAATLVVLAGKWLPAERVLLGAVPRTLGRMSFSLYLVHEPIAVSVAQLVPTAHPWLTPIITIPVALVVAVFFARFVELPAHRLAKTVSKRVSGTDGGARRGRRVAESVH
ncbi:MAG: acyltransferase [Curtobacterium sp.]|jgi:peptidoglycan/LPS O-acetylase OafA/YrhL